MNQSLNLNVYFLIYRRIKSTNKIKNFVKSYEVMAHFEITNEYFMDNSISDITTYLINNNITKLFFRYGFNPDKLEFMLLNIPESIKTIYFIGYEYKIYKLVSNFIKITKIRKIGFVNIVEDDNDNVNEFSDILDLIADNKYIKKICFTRNIDYQPHFDKLFNIKSLESIYLSLEDNYVTFINNLINNKNLIKLTLHDATTSLILEIAFALIFNKTLKYLKINTKLEFYELFVISKMLDINKSLLEIKYDRYPKTDELHNDVQQKLARNKQLLADIIDNRTRVIFYIPEMMEFYQKVPILH